MDALSGIDQCFIAPIRTARSPLNLALRDGEQSPGCSMVVAEKKVGFSFINIVLRPLVRFIYSYFFRLGFLDGKEGLLVLMNHAAYVSWKYAKAWEMSKRSGDRA